MTTCGQQMSWPILPAIRMYKVSLFVVTLLALGAAFTAGQHSRSIGLAVPMDCDDRYNFINPSFRCVEAEQKQEYVVFKEKLISHINDLRSVGIQSVAVYFRDLENGPWFGIDEDELFSPASTMKVPVMVAYYKKAQEDPSILQRQIEIGNTDPTGDEDVLEGSLQVGATYTVDELIRRMIVYSDNAPLHILFAYLGFFFPSDDIFAETLAEMGMAKSEGSVDDYMTVKRYASVYRVLYNASYLSKDMSQRALDMLSRSASPQGIRDGVPQDVQVAHKFGLRTPTDAAIQLHDCGIVYYPQNHYILCIMTKGSNVEALSAAIRDISAMTYAEVVRRSER